MPTGLFLDVGAGSLVVCSCEELDFFLMRSVLQYELKCGTVLIPKVKLKNKNQSRIGEIPNNPCYLNLSSFFF